MTPHRILITGPLGHIGSHLIRNLDEAVFSGDVILMDNLESRRFPSLYGLPKSFSFRFVCEDILTADFDTHLKDVFAVVHLAALTDAEGSAKIPEQVEAVNCHGLKRVADACLRRDVRLLFPSTTSVYQSQASSVDETCADLGASSPYAESKLNAERYLRTLSAQGLRCVVCRFGTVFGHSIGMRYDTAVNKFAWQAITGLPITIWSSVWKQKRPYLYLGDCVQAINLIMRRDLFDGNIYNVLTATFTVEEVVSAIRQFIPEAPVSFVESPIMDQLSFGVDDAKLRAVGYRPTGTLANGIREIMASFGGIMAR